MQLEKFSVATDNDCSGRFAILVLTDSIYAIKKREHANSSVVVRGSLVAWTVDTYSTNETALVRPIRRFAKLILYC